ALAAQALPLVPAGAPGGAALLFAEVPGQARAHERVTLELSALHASVLRLRSGAAFIVNEPGIAEEWRRIAATLERLRQDLEDAPRRGRERAGSARAGSSLTPQSGGATSTTSSARNSRMRSST
ncbi:MAG: hypothetical protein KGL43_02375, partial [Burkholderiales bacterium]|nr:hypothetical protein [Burkholderiales bacterium]